MAYEIYTRITTRETAPTVNISKFGRIGLNRASAAIMRQNAVEKVLLLWDRDAHKVGLKPISKKDDRSYSLIYGRKDAYAMVAGRSFLNYIGYDGQSRTVPAKWNDRETILEIEIPADSIKNDKNVLVSNVAELKQKRG